MSPSLQRTIYTGAFIYPITLDVLDIREHFAVGVDEDGIIRHRLDRPSDDDATDEQSWAKAAAELWGWGEDGWQWVKGGQEGRSWWFPGFVDTHIHASQYPNTGLFGKTTLLSWLETYTYPVESSLSSPEKAHKVYNSCVARTLSRGTTTASYFATAHASSTIILADICLQKGQRAFIGRVCMDSDLSPEYYRDESPEFAIKETKAVIAHIDSIDPEHKLITPILTPRFAPSCSSKLLSDLGDLASKTQLPIQTHISENTSEIDLVRSLFPNHTSYAEVYSAYNLLTPKTVLAHGIHLTPSELRLIAHHHSGISHCPVSNTSLSSGLCPVRTLLSHGITVGLGTDVSGGYSSSILVAAREAAMVSRTLAAVTPEGDGKEEEDKTRTHEKSSDGQREPQQETEPKGDSKKLSVEECLYLATRGGAHCLGLGSRLGGFEIGMEWDAQLIELASADPPSSPPHPLHQSSHTATPAPPQPTQAANQLSAAFATLSETPSTNPPPAITTTALNTSIPPPTSKSQPPSSDRDPEPDLGSTELWGTETWNEKVAKWVFCGDDRNTRRVYVRGWLVCEKKR